MLVRLVANDVLDSRAAETLVVTLCKLPLNDDGRYAGGVARWIQGALIPALGIEASDVDQGLIASLSGASSRKVAPSPARPSGKWRLSTRPRRAGNTSHTTLAREAGGRAGEPRTCHRGDRRTAAGVERAHLPRREPRSAPSGRSSEQGIGNLVAATIPSAWRNRLTNWPTSCSAIRCSR